MSWNIRQGDCRELLRAMPAESVHCVVTSPPYWGLRDYGLPPLVWGGDAGCEHEWDSNRWYVNGGAATGVAGGAFSKPGPENAKRIKEGRWREAATCSKCHAWRGSLGLEPTPELYIAHMVEVFREVKRVMRKDATCWVNMGDSYASGGTGGKPSDKSTLSDHGQDGRSPYLDQLGESTPRKVPPGLKPKDLCGMPWRLAFALQADGWWLRSEIIWHKPNPMPESVTDRPTKAHETVFLLTKSARYYYDAEAIREPVKPDPRNKLWGKTAQTSAHDHEHDAERGMTRLRTQAEGYVRMSNPAGRNRRTVWTIPTFPFSGVAVGGTRRITLPDCPVHGRQAEPHPAPGCDDTQGASQSGRNPDKHSRPVPAPESVVSATLPGLGAHPSDASFAKDRSTQSHRTGDPSEPGETYDDTPSSRTEYTVPRDHSDASDGRTPESSTGADSVSNDSAIDPLGQSSFRNTYKSTTPAPSLDPPICTCKYTRKERKVQHHFAVFPPALIEPMILTSPTKCCAVCLTGWERVMHKELRPDVAPSELDRYGTGETGVHRKVGQAYQNWKDEHPDVQLGFRPGCECHLPPWVPTPRQGKDEEDEAYAERLVPYLEQQGQLMVVYAAHEHETVPATVCDPFLGSGTSIMVALRHGRNAIGQELSEAYAEMARRRIVDDSPMFNGGLT